MKKLKVLQVSEKVNSTINSKYSKNENNQKIAKKCLELCEEWAIINLDHIDGLTRKNAKSDCKKYVKNALKDDEVVGSLLIMIITGIIVRLIVDWIVNNFIYNLKK